MATHPYQPGTGTVIALCRYPVKSMMGESLTEALVTPHGLLGDREYALVDQLDGKVASAKNPRKWPNLFRCYAAYPTPPQPGEPIWPVDITLPDGTVVSSSQPDINQVLSQAVNRAVMLKMRTRQKKETVETTAPNPWTPVLEEYWPEMDGLSHQNSITDEALPEGSFFDLATIHLVTTATLKRLHELYPAGQFLEQRFRPNIVIDTGSSVQGFVENSWIGKTIVSGNLSIQITRPCQRCVMTTLPQGNLPNDPGILRTAALHNHVQVGVYGTISRTAVLRLGDAITME